MKTKIFELVWLMLLSINLTFGQPGTLDLDFNADGIVITDIGSNWDLGNSLAVQQDGKILVAGSSSDGSHNDFALVRYNTDGTPDNTFGVSGIVTIDIGSNSDDYCESVAIQSDDKILVAGYSYVGSDPDITLVRYNTDGTLDNTFGANGIVTTDIGSNSDDYCESVAIQSDDKILAAGFSWNGIGYYVALVRYSTNGTLDNTFGIDGIETTYIGSYGGRGKSLAVQQDGKILVAGYSYNGTETDFALVRYNTDGTFDNTFSVDGIVVTDIGSNYDFGESVTVQQDGKILVAGSSSDGSGNDFALVRYNTDGTLDNTFGTNGIVTTDMGRKWERGWSVAVQQDGKILVTGEGYSSESVSDMHIALVRYNIDGTLDNTFGIDGIVTTNMGSHGGGRGNSVIVQQDGKILVAGYSYGSDSNADIALVRYISGLVLVVIDFKDDSFSYLIYPNPIKEYAYFEYTLPRNEVISIDLYDLNGRLIKSFINSEKKLMGTHKELLYFDKSIQSGNYLLVIKNDEKSIGINILVQ